MKVNTYAFPFTSVPLSTTQWYAQTFVTTSKALAIKAVVVDLEVNATTPASIITCSIRNVSGGVPTGSDIGGQIATVDGPLGSGSYPSTFGRMVFSSPVAVLPNTTYAVVIRVNATGSGNTWLHSQTLGIYSSGNRCSSANGGVTWTSQVAADINCLIYETQTQVGKAHRTDPSLATASSIGWNTTSSCLEANGCPIDFYGKNDQADNPIGIATNNALPGQMVTVQLSGFSSLITGFLPGRRLYLTSPPGSVNVTGIKSAGISTGNGIIIQITY